MANTTWSATDKSANITLTGSNLIATSTSAARGGVRAADKQITGKFYWEVTCTTFVGANNVVGVFSPTADFTLGYASVIGQAAINRSGQVYIDGNTPLNFSVAITSGTVICIAVDCAARLIWFRYGAAGNWNNVAANNPATGVGGLPFYLGLGVPVYPCAVLQTASDQVTANFGGSAFTGTVPSGFTSGFTSGVTSPTNALATQTALEAWLTTTPQAQVTQAGLEAWYAATTTNPAQVTQVALEEWAASTAPAQVTQVAMEMWASVALYTPPPFIPPPPPEPPPTHGKGHGGKPPKGGPPKAQAGAPALQSEISRFEAFRPRHKHRALGIFPPAITVLTLSESAAGSAALAATVRYAAALIASASAADAIVSGRLLAALLAEGSTSSAAISALLGAKGTLAESGHGADALSATAKMLAALAASAVTSDTPYHGVTAPGMLSESAVSSAVITAFLATHGTLAEGSTTAAAVAGFRTLLAGLTETGAGSDALAGKLSHGASLSEGSATHDALSAMAKMLAGLDELEPTQDVIAATAILRAALTEAAGTIDADTYVATTHPLRHAAQLIGRQSSPNLEGEWREPNG